LCLGVGTRRQASAKCPSDWFTGSVRIHPLFQAPDPALVQDASVTSETETGGQNETRLHSP